MSEKVITVRHELIKPKPDPEVEKPKPKEKPVDDDRVIELESQMVSLISYNLQLQKDFAVDRFPEHKQEIMDADNEATLTDLIEEFESDIQPYKAPSGKATLPLKPDYSTGLDRAETEADLINRLYEQAKDRDKTKKKIALAKIDRLYKGMVTNPKLGRAVKEIPKFIRYFQACPKCSAVSETNFNIEKQKCPSCGFVVGEGSYTRKVY